ncbi:ribonuclease III [Aminivibrio sp.]|jgi:ribonuclease-3|uniref:ribonuclease III n=1 Tax=Aminivibrio sp. TaxID=1872489 RepID=UPI001A5D3EEA|nr:ribonuclease III [Aminivibrio sp.]MBL3538601.1 ribonuclease III [Aminivibrio sp.]
MNYAVWFSAELEKLQDRIGYHFSDVGKLENALVHSSYAYEKGKLEHNERMEYLGDAVLELGVSRFLYDSFPSFDEGRLTRSRAALVCGKSLAEWGRELGLSELLRTGKGLETEQVRHGSLCSDAVEALVGAVFLDGGYSRAMDLVVRYIAFHLSRHPIDGDETDPKSALQMLAHEKGMPSPVYEVLSVSGSAHSPIFSVRVLIGSKESGAGDGESRKAAEFAAARNAFFLLNREELEPE